jgi:co-chaperonin GroES (HSP10)
MADDELQERGGVVYTQFGAYDKVEWTGENTSGLKALCDKIVVLPDQAADMYGSIHIPDDIKSRTGLAATTGVIVSVGPQAFAYDSSRMVKWVGERPEIGTRIIFTKYCGVEHTGHDGLLYRIMLDRDVGAMEDTPSILQSESNVTAHRATLDETTEGFAS